MSAGTVGAQAGAQILAVNAGSSSLKYGVYAFGGDGEDLGATLAGTFEGLEVGGRPRWRMQKNAAGGAAGTEQALAIAAGESAFDAALTTLLRLITAQVGAAAQPAAVAHRIVHGGELSAPVLIDDSALSHLHSLDTLAPLHQPFNLAGVEAFRRALPGVAQIACFDTAFHATLPDVERRFALPPSIAAMGIRRYGFHGLSYDFLVQALTLRTKQIKGRALLAHLGNGASITGTIGGRSVATSMGFSTLDGLMMGTRSGSVDPGVLLHLWRAGWERERVERLLYKESGLAGVSGIGADMRALRASDSPAARLAIELYTHRLIREAGAITAALGGVDLIAFTGGIGEHDAVLRADLVNALGFLGLRLDDDANRAASGDAMAAIHAEGSSAEVWVVPTDEGRVAARSAWRMLAATGAPSSER
jgi:acetate kinase